MVNNFFIGFNLPKGGSLKFTKEAFRKKISYLNETEVPQDLSEQLLESVLVVLNFNKENSNYASMMDIIKALKDLPDLLFHETLWDSEELKIEFVDGLMKIALEEKFDNITYKWAAIAIHSMDQMSTVKHPYVKMEGSRSPVKIEWLKGDELRTLVNKIEAFNTWSAELIRQRVMEDKKEEAIWLYRFKVQMPLSGGLPFWFYSNLKFFLDIAKACKKECFDAQDFQEKSRHDGFADGRIGFLPIETRIERLVFLLKTCNGLNWDADIKEAFEDALIVVLNEEKKFGIVSRVKVAEMIHEMTSLLVESDNFTNIPLVEGQLTPWFSKEKIREIIKVLETLVDSNPHVARILHLLTIRVAAK